jgi:hypothetical protein
MILNEIKRYWPIPESACRRVSRDKHEAELLLGLTPYDWTFPESACRRESPEFITFPDWTMPKPCDGICPYRLFELEPDGSSVQAGRITNDMQKARFLDHLSGGHSQEPGRI